MTHKKRKKSRIFMFLGTGCSLLRAEGLSCSSLGVLYGGLGMSKLQFLIKKIKIKFPAINFFQFQAIKPGSGSRIRIRDPGIRIRNQKKCWILIRIRIRIKSMQIRNPGQYFGCLNVSLISLPVHTSFYLSVFLFLPSFPSSGSLHILLLVPSLNVSFPAGSLACIYVCICVLFSFYCFFSLCM